jgi:hypothetical protein
LIDIIIAPISQFFSYSIRPFIVKGDASSEYDVEFTVSAVYSGSGTRILFAFGRYTDTDNAGYAIELINGGTTAQKLLKRSGGSTTELDSNTNATNAGDKFKLEIRDASKKVYLDFGSGYVEILTSADNTITSTGRAASAGVTSMKLDTLLPNGGWTILLSPRSIPTLPPVSLIPLVFPNRLA